MWTHRNWHHHRDDVAIEMHLIWCNLNHFKINTREFGMAYATSVYWCEVNLSWCWFGLDFPLSIIYGVFYHFTHWKHTNWFLTSSFIWRNEISWNLLWQLDLRFASQMIILIFSAIQNVFQCIFHSHTHTHTHRHKKSFQISKQPE